MVILALAIHRLFHRRYPVDGKEDCEHFPAISAWYYDRDTGNCQNYDVCANKDVLFLQRFGNTIKYITVHHTAHLSGCLDSSA